MNYLFIGIQGSGKGTQAKVFSEKLKIPHISTGDLLRATEGELRKEVDSYILKGNLVPDELILRILKKRMGQPDCENGFILDGYPRNFEQAKALDCIVKIDNAFNIEISDEEAKKRLATRLNCKNCGSVFNLKTNPPKQSGICDKCGKELTIRKDDSEEEAINQRIQIYHKEMTPVIKFYNTVKVNGMQPIEQVTQDIDKAIKFLRMFK
jgi:adenylate kinase